MFGDSRKLASAPNIAMLGSPPLGLPRRGDHADVAAAQDVAPQRARLRSWWRRRRADALLAGLDVQRRRRRTRPALPVTRPPAITGMVCPLARPICRLKNMTGTSSVSPAPRPARLRPPKA